MVVASGDIRLPRLLRRQAGAEVDRLYRRHADEVFRYALMVMRSRPDAEDITQTVFVRALRAIERGEKVRTPRNWLIKIAHNECRRLLSSRKVHAELPEDIAVEPVERADVAGLRKAMAGLPEAQRKALCLRELEGRTYVEIATELGVSVSAVETLIFRARRTLREQLEAAISCEDFALLLEDPDARSRIRAHARVCPECATLERQARGRKSALRRIASMLGLPMWGTKLAAIGLTAAAVVAAAAPAHGLISHHHAARSKGSTTPTVEPRPVVAPKRRVPGTTTNHPLPGTRAVAPVATPVRAAVRPAAVRPVTPVRTATPAPVPLRPRPVPGVPSEPALPPAAAVPAPAAATPPPTAAHVPTVTTPAVVVSTPPVDTPVVTVPTATVSVPTVTVSVPAVPEVPTVSTPVATPKVSLP